MGRYGAAFLESLASLVSLIHHASTTPCLLHRSQGEGNSRRDAIDAAVKHPAAIRGLYDAVRSFEATATSASEGTPEGRPQMVWDGTSTTGSTRPQTTSPLSLVDSRPVDSACGPEVVST
jgi:hypothetical protein